MKVSLKNEKMMLSKSEIRKSLTVPGIASIRFRILVSCILLIAFTRGQQPGQVLVTVAVAPPYTSKVNEYVYQTNKVITTLVYTGIGLQDVNLQGSIISEGGIRIFTDPEYKLSQPITLSSGIPYMLTTSELQEIYNVDYLEFEGITQEDLYYGNGLPEDYWQLCIWATDYETGEPLSAEEPQGCSNVFFVADLESPIVQSPFPGQEIIASVPQNVIFSCTWPPGAPPNTAFTLKIIEVLPGDRDINDAFQSAAYPIFFEKTFNTTSYLYGPADPFLVAGKIYAFIFTAFDPEGKLVFRNNGMSEVSSFIYKARSDTIK